MCLKKKVVEEENVKWERECVESMMSKNPSKKKNFPG